ncbi:uncharacterized protein N7483_009665 [Penicillium malachiteum]|uniref:uncharacterized protein n=1 Tax=Penicillium malachiteum TaxID=1324776 RepID=UPI0025474483|nr:uncharacterized protein N7483_009665 [Penicillium malachiteum]KAJ5721731.1 hypothetical protein N7483_009665 [Penicillium malachiteum]
MATPYAEKRLASSQGLFRSDATTYPVHVGIVNHTMTDALSRGMSDLSPIEQTSVSALLTANSIQDNAQDEQTGHMSPVASPPLTISTNHHFTDTVGSPRNHTSPVRREGLLVRHHANASDVSISQNEDSTALNFSHGVENNVQGAVTTEVGRFPKVSKFAGITYPQVFAKSAEELFKSSTPHIDVMGFFCPTMKFAEEFPLESFDQIPLVDKSVADRYLQREC